MKSAKKSVLHLSSYESFLEKYFYVEIVAFSIESHWRFARIQPSLYLVCVQAVLVVFIYAYATCFQEQEFFSGI